MKKQNFTSEIKIAIVGVGGGGCNTINCIFPQNNQCIAQGDFDYAKELMGDDLTEETFQRLGIETIAEIAKYIAQIKGTEISKYIAQMKGTDKAIGVFAIFKSNQLIEQGGFEFAKELLIRTFGEKEAKKVIEKLVKSMQTTNNFSYLSKVRPKQFADFLTNKHLQLIALNTDLKALQVINAHSKIQLGEKTTQGFGAGMDAELGAKSAQESYDAIKDALKDSNIVLITAGLGGGTGTGASPIVARIAKEIGALSIAVVTTPFEIEGKAREKIAQKGLDELKNAVDSFFVLPNEKLLSIIDKSLGVKDTLQILDSILAKTLLGLANIVSSDDGLSIDFADLHTILAQKGLGLIGVGEKDGADSAVNAIKEAMKSPLCGSFEGAKCAIIHYTINEKYPMQHIADANFIVQQQLDEDAFCKCGWTWDNSLKPNQVKATLIITGLKNA